MRAIIGAKHIPKLNALVNGVNFDVIDGQNYQGLIGIGSKSGNLILNPGEIEFPLKSAEEQTRVKSRTSHLGITQIVPFENSFKIYLGTDNSCCDGVVSVYDIAICEKGLVGKNTGAIEVPFNVHGLLANQNGQGIVYGSGCSGSGIRFFDFNKNSLEDVVNRKIIENSVEHDDKLPLGYAHYCLFFNVPQIDNGKFYVSYFDHERRFMSEDPRAPAVVMTQEVTDRFVMRAGNNPLKESYEICIDDKMKGREIELASIKDTVSRSGFLYNIGRLNWQTISIVGDELGKYLLSEKSGGSLK